MRVTTDQPTYKLGGFTGAKKVIFYNNGAATIYWGFESTTAAGGGDTQGIPLLAGDYAVLDGVEAQQQPIYFAQDTPGTIVLNYTIMR